MTFQVIKAEQQVYFIIFEYGETALENMASYFHIG
jgi:hypothetical protein